MADSVAIDTREITITPLFRYESIEDNNRSEREQRLVKKMIQVVEVRFAGTKNYCPVFPVDAVWKTENGQKVTYAERWADQYRAFVAGASQEAQGTPLEMLNAYGMSDANLSLCRALRIYSIEALYHLEGDALKSLGMVSNSLKEMARAYMSDRAKSNDGVAEMAALRAELAALKAQIPVKGPTPEEIEELLKASNDEYEAMTDEQLKEAIAAKVGRKPAGNPSRATLLSSIRELSAA
jgi:hypothetical protein